MFLGVIFFMFAHTEQIPFRNSSTHRLLSTRSLADLFSDGFSSDNLSSIDNDFFIDKSQSQDNNLPPREGVSIDTESQNQHNNLPPRAGVSVDTESPIQDNNLPPREGVSIDTESPIQDNDLPPREGVSIATESPIQDNNLPPREGVSIDTEPPSRCDNWTRSDDFSKFQSPCNNSSPNEDVLFDSSLPKNRENLPTSHQAPIKPKSKDIGTAISTTHASKVRALKQIMLIKHRSSLQTTRSYSICPNSVNCSAPCTNTSPSPNIQVSSGKAKTSDNFKPNHDKISTAVNPKLSRGLTREALPVLSDGTLGYRDPTTSCRGRCGLMVHIPCSCAQICSINGNCCSDMREECPQLIISERSRLKHLLQADVVCSKRTKTFVVTSCPRHSQWDSDEVKDSLQITSTEDVTTATYSGDTTVPDTNSTDSTHVDTDAFLSLLFAAPVTDLETGLVYENRSVALCNGAHDADIQPWKVIVKRLRHEVPQSLLDMEKMTNTDIYQYSVPDIPAGASGGSPCLSKKEIRSCKPEWLVDRPELEVMCREGGITYYTGPKKVDVYANIHCVLCNLGSDNTTLPLQDSNLEERFTGLSVIASFASNGLLRLSAKMGSSDWYEVDCSLAPSGRGDLQCSKALEELGGESLEFKRVNFAVATGYCMFTRSRRMEEELLRIIKCYLETYGEALFDTEITRFQTVYDVSHGLPLLQMSTSVRYTYKVTVEKRAMMWKELALLVHDANFCCEEAVPSNVTCTGFTCNVGGVEVPRIVSTSPGGGIAAWKLNEQDKRRKDGWVIFCESGVTKSIYGTMGNICVKEYVNTSYAVFFERAANVSCLGDKVGDKVIHKRARNSCNNAALRVYGLDFNTSWLLVTVLGFFFFKIDHLILKHNERPPLFSYETRSFNF